MVPSNLYDDLPAIKGKKLPICHSAMVPWTAQFVADRANEGLKATRPEGEGEEEAGGFVWDADTVMKVARENARKLYGV